MEFSCCGPRGTERSILASEDAEKNAQQSRDEKIQIAKQYAYMRTAVDLANQTFSLEVPRFTEGKLDVVVAEAGDPGGIPCFMFYGVGASRWFCIQFHEQAQQLGLRLICPDRPGFGGSQLWPQRNFYDWGDIVTALCEQMAIDKFGIWGHSSGGPHALAVAAHPALKHRVLSPVTVLGAAVPLSTSGSHTLASMSWMVPGVLIRGVSSMLPMGACDKVNNWPQLITGSREGKEHLNEAERAAYEKDDEETKALRALIIQESQRQGSRGFVEEVMLLCGKNGAWGFEFSDLDPSVSIKWVHGTADGLVSVQSVRTCVASLRDQVGIDVAYEEVDGGTHNGVFLTHAKDSLAQLATALHR